MLDFLKYFIVNEVLGISILIFIFLLAIFILRYGNSLKDLKNENEKDLVKKSILKKHFSINIILSALIAYFFSNFIYYVVLITDYVAVYNTIYGIEDRGALDWVISLISLVIFTILLISSLLWYKHALKKIEVQNLNKVEYSILSKKIWKKFIIIFTFCGIFACIIRFLIKK